MQFQLAKADRARAGSAGGGTAGPVVGIHDGAGMSEAARRLDRATGGAITRVLRRGDFSGKSAETYPLAGIRRGPAERILLVGLGAKSAFGRKPYRRAAYVATQWPPATGRR